MTHVRHDAARRLAESTPDAHRIDVAYVDGETYTADVRGFRLRVDQPPEAGGTDSAPTPTELFAASLATCVAFYAGRYLARHGVDRTDLRVRAGFTMATDRPARVAEVKVTISPPAGLPERRRAALLAVASGCTVHNTLHQPPAVTVDLEV